LALAYVIFTQVTQQHVEPGAWQLKSWGFTELVYHLVLGFNDQAVQSENSFTFPWKSVKC
jgi:N6-adenosine-specific RNA methylase IME4